jgi:hypothetical protein
MSILYTPGNEPENIRKKLENFFEKLDSAYPDKVVKSLHKEHKKWGETLTKLYREIGYESGNALLEAYGYTVSVSENKIAGVKKVEIRGYHTFVLLETKPRGHEVTLGVFGAILNLASQEK